MHDLETCIQWNGEENGNPFWYSCLENPLDRGDWRATVHGVTKESDMTERLNNTSKEKLYTLRRYENSSFQPEFEANRTWGRAQGVYLLVFFLRFIYFWLCWVFVTVWAFLWLPRAFALWQSTSPGATGLRSCRAQALGSWLSSCGTWA